MARLRLGEILIQQGLITEAQLQEAIETQKIEKIHIGEVFINKKMIREEDLASALGTQLLLPYASRSSGLLSPQQEQGLQKLDQYLIHLRIHPLLINAHSETCEHSFQCELQQNEDQHRNCVSN